MQDIEGRNFTIADVFSIPLTFTSRIHQIGHEHVHPAGNGFDGWYQL